MIVNLTHLPAHLATLLRFLRTEPPAGGTLVGAIEELLRAELRRRTAHGGGPANLPPSLLGRRGRPLGATDRPGATRTGWPADHQRGAGGCPCSRCTARRHRRHLREGA